MIYSLTYGYTSKINPERMFQSREAAEEFDACCVCDLLKGLQKSDVQAALVGTGSASLRAAILFAAERIQDLPILRKTDQGEV